MRRWTEAEKRFAASDTPVAIVAAILGRTKHAVRRRRWLCRRRK